MRRLSHTSMVSLSPSPTRAVSPAPSPTPRRRARAVSSPCCLEPHAISNPAVSNPAISTLQASSPAPRHLESRRLPLLPRAVDPAPSRARAVLSLRSLDLAGSLSFPAPSTPPAPSAALCRRAHGVLSPRRLEPRCLEPCLDLAGTLSYPSPSRTSPSRPRRYPLLPYAVSSPAGSLSCPAPSRPRT